MLLALILAAADPGVPTLLAALLALSVGAMLADGGPGMAASEADTAEVMLAVYRWV